MSRPVMLLLELLSQMLPGPLR